MDLLYELDGHREHKKIKRSPQYNKVRPQRDIDSSCQRYKISADPQSFKQVNSGVVTSAQGVGEAIPTTQAEVERKGRFFGSEYA
jgi:hypothetical protein